MFADLLPGDPVSWQAWLVSTRIGPLVTLSGNLEKVYLDEIKLRVHKTGVVWSATPRFLAKAMDSVHGCCHRDML